MKILVIGASGYLGKHVYSHFRNFYENVIGTYCVHQTDQTMVHFDMNTDDLSTLDYLCDNEKGCAIICAAESTYDACKIRKEECFQTNVVSTIRLIEKLKKKKYYIVFCSTESVYDGTKGNYKEIDSVNPINEYGEMKVQIEKYLMKNCPEAGVFRLSKMVGDVTSSRDTLYEWKQMAEAGKDIFCIKGNFFSPVDVEDVAKCVEIACKKRVRGIYNICGNKVYSRIELCLSFLSTLNMQANVFEKDLEKFEFSAKRPLNVSMCNEKAVNDLSYQFRDMEEVFIRYKEN